MVRRTDGPGDSNKINPTKAPKAGSKEQIINPAETSLARKVGDGIRKALGKLALTKNPGLKGTITKLLAEKAFGINTGDSKGGIVDERA